ncbi:hypothetical protein VOLCADRAFT_100094 [Volvox carteri f. nagariensis]|uniref:Uncharacterized protein n=1 Tax=Volvox carteri f. nagariensis TaxID=3068 RepID=D8UJE8_VOLCA|nr:uncharacterized protein VOLCADRAFT_100094 [Volvox carteri f. nagariensis]EFJ40177.1 hypothetical protein VOLCADRAFT_100094 [Volvox carteri f. nagariensis]|eukprot:XP_002958787.1 hypothetical protein VOLCADRAFT_100094 [Volvox carteri f. nagariensis]
MCVYLCVNAGQESALGPPGAHLTPTGTRAHRHPPLLGWLFVNSPDVVTSSSVFRAGQVFLFLRQLGVPNDDIVGPIFRWRALLAEDVDFEVTTVNRGGGRVLGRPIHGLANWSTAVAPKLAALEAVLPGGRPAAEDLLRRVPAALKYPPGSRLAPNIRLLTGKMGLQGESLLALLRSAPAVLSLSPEQLESRWTFLVEIANGSETDLLLYPPYLLTSLAKAFTEAGRKRFAEQLSLFYLLMQG